ncbi:hypothetical protein Tco_1030106 [Tanacetum coccineum]|uniref:Uncharacterized protein n=1 Tax=Tanacetum coccineum TaxID=301880 RepID=A0ABQ5G5A1_9ASTR
MLKEFHPEIQFESPSGVRVSSRRVSTPCLYHEDFRSQHSLSQFAQLERARFVTASQITADQSGCDTQPDVPTLTCAPGAHDLKPLINLTPRYRNLSSGRGSPQSDHHDEQASQRVKGGAAMAKVSGMTTSGGGGTAADGGDGSGGSGSGDGDTDGDGGSKGGLGLLRDDDGKSDGDGEDDDRKSGGGGEDDDGISDGSSG